MSIRQALGLLIGAHLVLDAAFLCLLQPHVNLFAHFVFTALVGCQALLFGFAGAYAIGPQPLTPGGQAALLLSCLATWFMAWGVAWREPLFVTLMAPTATAVAFFVGLALRRYGIELRRTHGMAAAQTGVFQFSLRHLLVLTGAIALLMAPTHALRGVMRSTGERDPRLAVIVLVVVSFSAVSIGLAASWAMLGRPSPRRRLPMTAIFTAMAAAPASLYFGFDWEDYFLLTGLALMLLLVTAASLWLPRTLGFRAVAGRVPPAYTGSAGDRPN